MKHKLLLKLIHMFILSVVGWLLCLQSFEHKRYDVPGIVISKNIEQYAHGKNNRNMSTRYIMCVKPNDTAKFKHYSVYVNYATYCTNNVGDKITFSVSEDECIKDFKRSELREAIYFLLLITFAVLSIFLFLGIASILVEKAISRNFIL